MTAQDKLKKVNDGIAALLEDGHKKDQDPDTVFDTPSYVVWQIFTDAMRHHITLAKKQPTTVYLPRTIELMLSMYLKKHVSPESAKLRETKKILGLNICFDYPNLVFN